MPCNLPTFNDPHKLSVGALSQQLLTPVGDSLALSFLVAILPILAVLILLGVFVVDATVTLIRRMAHGERFYEAHRSHAYQHAAVHRGAHMPVTVAVGVIMIVAVGLDLLRRRAKIS